MKSTVEYSAVFVCKFRVPYAKGEDAPRDASSPEGDCPLYDDCNVNASSLAGLINALDHEYGFDPERKWGAVRLAENPAVAQLVYGRLEIEDGREPVSSDWEGHRAGLVKVYSCQYRFTVRKRRVLPIAKSEFKALGIDV